MVIQILKYRNKDDTEIIIMKKYGIDDIRLFYENDERFLEQF